MNKFYKTEHLTFDEKKQILNEARKKCFIWWVDILKNYKREKIDITFDDMMKKFKEDSHLIITLRDDIIEGMYFEVAFRITEIVDYFLWIKLNLNEEYYFVKKYKLKEYE